MPVLNVILDVKPFTQSKSWSCWAAAAVILRRWKENSIISELEIAAAAGNKFERAFQENKGLRGPDFSEFAFSLGMKIEAPQNFTPTGYHDLLKSHGPLWIATRLDDDLLPRRHVRVLRGVTGDGTFDGSTAYVLDPGDGGDYQQTVAQLARELENIAKEEIANGRELFSQIIHFS